MGQRNRRGGRGAQGGSHARHNFVGNAGPPQRFDLFPGASEDQRIAAFQPDHTQSGICERNHQKVDLHLRNIFLPAALAHVVYLRRGRNETQDFWSDQVVVEHRICRSPHTQRFQREQLRVARSRTHQINFPLHAPSPFVASSGVSAKAASSASLLARECNKSSLRSSSRSLARISFRVSPSSATHAAYPEPNCFQSCYGVFSEGFRLRTEVETERSGTHRPAPAG